MYTLNGALIGSGLFTAAVSDPPLQDRVIAGLLNSLIDHDRTTHPRSAFAWIDKMMDADGGQSIEAQWGYDTSYETRPPNFDQNDTAHGVASPGAATGGSASWASNDAANFTDYIHCTDNFHWATGGGGSSDPADSPYVEALGAIITGFEDSTDDTVRYWLYEPWRDGDGYFGEFTGAELVSGDWADWRAANTGTYGTWFDDWVADVKVANPDEADRITLIPMARIMVDVMEMSELSAMASTDWFHDNAPHGVDCTYVLSAMVIYTYMMEQQAPTPSFTGASIHSAFSSNYTAIAARVYAHFTGSI